MTDPALKKVIDKAYGPMDVGRIIVLRGIDDRISVEIQDATGWVMHAVGPIELAKGDTMTIECPRERP